MASGLSKILVFGGTGHLGKCRVRASIKMGHPTYVSGRPITPSAKPSKLELHKEFQSMGVMLILGELSEHEKLVSLIKQVDIVICALGTPHIMEQLKIIDAIKVAGNVKRFIPSDFGCDEDLITGLPPFQACLDKKKKIRRVIEATGVPFTYLSSTCFGEYFFSFLLHPHDKYSEELTIYGSGESKASPHPENVRAAIIHSIFVKGDMVNFEIREDEMEVSKLYPDVEYTTVDQLLDEFVANPPDFEYVEL